MLKRETYKLVTGILIALKSVVYKCCRQSDQISIYRHFFWLFYYFIVNTYYRLFAIGSRGISHYITHNDCDLIPEYESFVKRELKCMPSIEQLLTNKVNLPLNAILKTLETLAT